MLTFLLSNHTYLNNNSKHYDNQRTILIELFKKTVSRSPDRQQIFGNISQKHQ